MAEESLGVVKKYWKECGDGYLTPCETKEEAVFVHVSCVGMSVQLPIEYDYHVEKFMYFVAIAYQNGKAQAFADLRKMIGAD